MTAKRIKRAQRWRGRRYTRAINAALAAANLGFKVRIRPLRNLPRRIVETNIARAGHRLALPKDDPHYVRFARFVNARLALPIGGLDRAAGSCECVRCGAEVEMTASPDEWQRRKDRRWKVTGYWPGTGECCELLYADDFECTRVFELRPATAEATTL